jgi:hypothetical protein
MICAKNEKYAEIGRRMRAIPQEKRAPSYEWEELVQKMCSSDDAGLQGIGQKERESMNQNISGRNGTSG